MSFTLNEGRVLLVDGPAAITVRTGRISIFGADVALGRRVVVRRGKALPLLALEDATLERIQGDGSAKVELTGSTIPQSWTKVAEEVLTQRLSSVMVLGATDRGKNSFSIYLTNNILKRGDSVAFIDGDVGQGDIGPPAAVSVASVTSPIFDLFTLSPEDAVFIGSTTPTGVQNRVTEGISTLREEADQLRPRLTLLNTDGWVFGNDAVAYKLRLITIAAPQAVIGIQLNDELEPILTAAESDGHHVLRLEPSSAAHSRDRDMRRSLREQCYHKFLRGAAVRRFSFSDVRFEYTFLNSPLMDDELCDHLSNLLDCPTLVYVGPDKCLRILVKDSREIDEATILKAASVTGRTFRFVCADESKGLLLGLMNVRGRFLGLGVLEGIDFGRRSLEVLTPCIEAPRVICFGRIRLDEELREIGFTQAYEP